MSGTNKPESKVGRIRAYFDANPDDELTYKDIAQKFSITEVEARSAVKLLRERRQLETVHVIRATPQRRAEIREKEAA